MEINERTCKWERDLSVHGLFAVHVFYFFFYILCIPSPFVMKIKKTKIIWLSGQCTLSAVRISHNKRQFCVQINSNLWYNSCKFYANWKDPMRIGGKDVTSVAKQGTPREQNTNFTQDNLYSWIFSLLYIIFYCSLLALL